MRSKIRKLWMVLLCTTLAMTQLPAMILADSCPPVITDVSNDDDIDVIEEDDSGGMIVEEQMADPMSGVYTEVVSDGNTTELIVNFNDNVNGGSDITNNDMKAAIDNVITSQSVDSENIKTIRLTGDADEITDYNWSYLIHLYHQTSTWTELTTLDLSGMTNLKTIKGNVSGATGKNIKLNILILPDSLNEIGIRAFYGCEQLELTSLPQNLTTIGNYAFSDCAKLALTSLPQNLTTIGDSAFYYCSKLALTSLPQNLTTIGNSAFSGCSKLALTSLPQNLTTVGHSAFYYCSELALTSLPDNLTTIGPYAFSDCSELALTSLPQNLTTIGDSAFYYCSKLALTSLPQNLTTVGHSVFYGCSELALTSLPDNLTTIGPSVFYGCSKLALTSLPQNLTTVGHSAFYGCSKLALTSLPQNLTTVGHSAFYGCSKLALTSLPDNLTTIEGYAFYNCSKLALTSLPQNLTTIGSYAFSGCQSLAYIIMKRAAAPTLGTNAFPDTNPELTFYIPQGGTGYDQDGWKSLKKQEYIPTAEISLNTDHLTLYPNTSQNTATLNAAIKPKNAKFKQVLWTSSDTDIATVDQNGNVTAIAIGTAIITATSWQGGKTATCTVTVRSPHTHYFSSDWMYNDSQHWKECSCGARSQIADHSYGSWSITRATDGNTPGTCKRTCDVCGHEQIETVAYRTLTDPATGITVSSHFTSDAALSVKEAVLHEDGTCPACAKIRAGQDEGDLLLLYDISLSSGIYDGKIEVIIPVDKKYNGNPLILLHCMDKTEEQLVTEVKDGCVGGTFTSLSPFAVLEIQKVESIHLTQASLTLELGKSRQLDAAVTPSDAHNKNVTWKTSNKNVAAVSASGEVTAVKAGTATITCTAADGGGAKATCKVTVRNTATPLIILKGSAGKNSIRLNWNQISNADGYEIYGSRCGETYSYKKIKTITKGITTTWTQSKLKAATAYKYYIKAYKLANGRKLYLRTSKTSHVVTTGGRYTNVKSVTTTFTDITLAKGKTRQISAHVIPVKKSGEFIAHVPEFRYKTTNGKVATVTASGKIKAVGKGKCSIYVYANNGVTKRIQITVK